MSIKGKIWALVTCMSVMGVTGWIVLGLLPHGELAYSLDSIRSLNVARDLTHGHGLSLFNYSLFDPRYLPYTSQAPLFPIVLASGMKPEWIQALAIAGVAALAFWLLARRAEYPLPIASGLALIVALPWPVLLDASYVWSDPLTLFWVFAAIAALSGIGHGTPWSTRRDVGYCLAAVIAIVLAVYTHYVAILFMPGIILALLRAPIPWSKRILLMSITLLAALALLAPLFIYNLISSGQFSGEMYPSSHLPFTSPIFSLLFYIGWVFAVTPVTRTLLVVFVISLILATILYWKDSKRVNTKANVALIDQLKWLFWGVACLAVAYIVGIVMLGSWKTFNLGPRIISPASSLLLLAIAVWAQVMWKGTSSRWEQMVLVLPLCGILGLAGSTSLQMWEHAYQAWHATGSPHWPKSPVVVYANLSPISLPKVKGTLICEHPEVIAFRTGWDTRQIPKGLEPRELLSRIANRATGIVIDSRQAVRLAEELRTIVPHPHLLRLDGVPLLVWEQAKEP